MHRASQELRKLESYAFSASKYHVYEIPHVHLILNSQRGERMCEAGDNLIF